MHPHILTIMERWYLTESALFAIVCSHNLVANENIRCPFRTGKGRIEYSPQWANLLPLNTLELFFKAEAVRILLRHPYERVPYGCKGTSIATASNIVLADNYDFSSITMQPPAHYGLPSGGSYEWYAINIDRMELGNNQPFELIFDIKPPIDPNKQSTSNDEGQASGHVDSNTHNNDDVDSNTPLDPNEYHELKMADGSIVRIKKNPQPSHDSDTQAPRSNSDNNSSDDDGDARSDEHGSQSTPQHPDSSTSPPLHISLEDVSQLWEEDPFMVNTIEAVIDEISSWGSLPTSLTQQIITNSTAQIDYRKTLSGFKATVLSSTRRLTRMKPNRRSGFENMGSIRRFDTSLLLAVDVSPSISNDTLSDFYSIISNFFRYGVKQVDVIQFDSVLSEVKRFDKKFERVEIDRHNGTNFQPIFDFIEKNPKYDGLIIFTDGLAAPPRKSKRVKTKIVWVCCSQKRYLEHKDWMRRTGRCCAIEL